MHVIVLRMLTLFGAVFLTLEDMTNTFQNELSFGVLDIGYMILATVIYGVLLNIFLGFPLMFLFGFYGRITSRTLRMGNEKVAQQMVDKAQEILDEQYPDDEIQLLYAEHLREDHSWSHFYYKAQSPALEQLEDKYGQSYGFAIRLHGGWMPHYIITKSRSMNSMTDQKPLYYGGGSNAGARVLAKQAKAYHDKAVRMTKYKKAPKSFGLSEDDEFAIRD